MFTEVLTKASVRRLVDILRARYGVGLGFGFLTGVPSKPEERHAPSWVGGALHFPIWHQEQYLATAIIKGNASLSAQQLQEIRDLLYMVLEPELYLGLLTSNEAQNPSSTKIPGQVFFLSNSSPILFQKACAEIHEFSARWASLRRISTEYRFASVQDLLSLGEITLVIDDISLLSDVETEILRQYLVADQRLHGPLMLIGAPSDSGYQNLIQLERLPLESSRFRLALELILDPTAAMI